MIHNRKNTSTVVSTWRDYLNGKSTKRNLNESIDDEDGFSARERNEFFEALIADLLECEWEQNRIDTLIDVIQRCNPSDSELKTIAYGESESYDLNNDPHLSDEEEMPF